MKSVDIEDQLGTQVVTLVQNDGSEVTINIFPDGTYGAYVRSVNEYGKPSIRQVNINFENLVIEGVE